MYMSVGVMKDYKLKLRNSHASDTGLVVELEHRKIETTRPPGQYGPIYIRQNRYCTGHVALQSTITLLVTFLMTRIFFLLHPIIHFTFVS
jgi:hypothetical protein